MQRETVLLRIIPPIQKRKKGSTHFYMLRRPLLTEMCCFFWFFAVMCVLHVPLHREQNLFKHNQNIYFVNCSPLVCNPSFHFFKLLSLQSLQALLKVNISFCVLFILSAYSENMWKIDKHQWRMLRKYERIRRKYLPVFANTQKESVRTRRRRKNTLGIVP